MNSINPGIPSEEKSLTKRETQVEELRHKKCLELKQFPRLSDGSRGSAGRPEPWGQGPDLGKLWSDANVNHASLVQDKVLWLEEDTFPTLRTFGKSVIVDQIN